MKVFLEELRSFSIVIPGDTEKATAFAASELASGIEKSTGVILPVAAEKKTPRAIFFSIEADDCVKFDGFRIASSGGDITISAVIPRGLLNGVYTILSSWGFRRVWQKRFLEVVPKIADALDFREGADSPDIEFRGVCIFSVWPGNEDEIREILDFLAWNRFNLLMTSVHRTEKRSGGWRVEWINVEKKLYPELEKRGTILNISEHSGRWFFPVTLFQTHPEWFAMNNDGIRYPNGQICYSNQEAVKYLAARYCEYAKAHPEVQILGIWPEDGYGFCQCENCRQPGTVLNAVNYVAKELEKIRPDLLVEYLSYTEQTSKVPPDMLPNKNIITLVANMNMADEWLRKSDLVGAKGGYRLHYHITDNTAERANLPVVIGQTLDDCREMLAHRLRGVIPFYIGPDTWWRSNLNLFVLSQGCWKTRITEDDLLSDLASHYFPAAEKEAALVFYGLEHCPHVNQFIPPPWKIWQLWPTIRTDYAGEKWSAVCAEFEHLYDGIRNLKKRCAGNSVSSRLIESMEKFVDFQRITYESWHFRALAVLAFDENNAEKVKANIIEAGKCERILVDAVCGSDAETYGVAGAWIDYEFFVNWRLQLDKQLLEMRTVENQKPFIDMNPDVELFLPGLLGN